MAGKDAGDTNAIDIYLSTLGHNVMSATMAGRENDHEETQSQHAYTNDDDPDISSWIPTQENSVFEDLENEDVYEHRNIRQKKKPCWSNEKCASCKTGFNSRSKPVKCDECDRYTHKKVSCLKETYEKSQFFCRVCVPTNHPGRSEDEETHITNVVNGFKCQKCDLIVKTKYSMMRHVTRMHDDQGNVEVENVIESSQENTEPPEMTIEPNVEPPQEITEPEQNKFARFT